MLDEEGRRKKAAKIVAVVRHALGVESPRRAAGGRRRLLGRASSPTSWPWPGRSDERGRHRRAGAREGPRPVRRAGRLPARPRRGPALRRRLGRRRRAQPHLRARRRPRGRRRRHPPRAAPGRRALPRHRPPLAGGRAAPPAAVPVVAAATGRRPLPAGSPAGASTTTSATTPRPGCGGSSRPSTCGTTPCPCSPTRGLLRRRQRPGLGGQGAAGRVPGRAARWCRPTSGRRSRARPRPAGPPLRVPPRHLT